jgi:hypothetical protein
MQPVTYLDDFQALLDTLQQRGLTGYFPPSLRTVLGTLFMLRAHERVALFGREAPDHNDPSLGPLLSNS